VHIEPRKPTVENPPEQCAGDVWLDVIAAPHTDDQRMTVAAVRFAGRRADDSPGHCR